MIHTTGGGGWGPRVTEGQAENGHLDEVIGSSKEDGVLSEGSISYHRATGSFHNFSAAQDAHNKPHMSIQEVTTNSKPCAGMKGGGRNAGAERRIVQVANSTLREKYDTILLS